MHLPLIVIMLLTVLAMFGSYSSGNEVGKDEENQQVKVGASRASRYLGARKIRAASAVPSGNNGQISSLKMDSALRKLLILRTLKKRFPKKSSNGIKRKSRRKTKRYQSMKNVGTNRSSRKFRRKKYRSRINKNTHDFRHPPVSKDEQIRLRSIGHPPFDDQPVDRNDIGDSHRFGSNGNNKSPNSATMIEDDGLAFVHPPFDPNDERYALPCGHIPIEGYKYAKNCKDH